MKAALERFKKHKHCDSLAGLWNECCCAQQFYEALCLKHLGDNAKARRFSAISCL
jgi:hypothetical protein